MILIYSIIGLFVWFWLIGDEIRNGDAFDITLGFFACPATIMLWPIFVISEIISRR